MLFSSSTIYAIIFNYEKTHNFINAIDQPYCNDNCM
jgi:hypothetical protein